MKKTRTVLIAVALCTGICTFAFKTPAAFCEDSLQYTLDNGNYVLAGVFGVDYTCSQLNLSTCTYIRSGNTFVPCRSGLYVSRHPPIAKN